MKEETEQRKRSSWDSNNTKGEIGRRGDANYTNYIYVFY